MRTLLSGAAMLCALWACASLAPAPTPPPPAAPAAAPARPPAPSTATPTAPAGVAAAPAPDTTTRGDSGAPAPATATATAKKPAQAAATPPKPASRVPAPGPSPVKPQAAAAATPASPAPPTLDLKGLEQRLKDTKAIGVFTKLALKNQVDDLLAKFRAHHQGKPTPALAELRQNYDMLVLKVLTLLQDGDPPLAKQILGSREALWGILSDPAKFANI